MMRTEKSMKRIFRWLVAAIALLAALWCLFPMRYSRDHAQAFQTTDTPTRQQLVNLLLADYAQMGQQDTDGRICYTVAYDNQPENRTAMSIHRLWEDRTTGKLMKAVLPTQTDVLTCLQAIDGFGDLLPEVDAIYVSPEKVLFSSHMGIREVFWQREGVPLDFFRDENYDHYRLYWLGGDWYHDYSIAR